MSENHTATNENHSQPTNIDPMDESHFGFNPTQTNPSLNINQTNSQNKDSITANNSHNPSENNNQNHSQNTSENNNPSNGGANVIMARESGETSQLRRPTIRRSTVLGTTLMITNICLGTTIFTFATRAKSFGLVWLLFFCLIIAAINYWAIMKCVIASSRSEHDDYSEICEEKLGRKWRIVLNVILIIYSYATVMCFVSLIFPLFGRFVQSGFYRNKYKDYDQFYDEKWGKAYIKYPFFAGLSIIIALLCLIKDINRLNFSAVIGVVACGYGLVVVMVQCKSYYEHYKDTVYKEDDKSTHPNWFNLGKAFTKDLVFLKESQI